MPQYVTKRSASSRPSGIKIERVGNTWKVAWTLPNGTENVQAQFMIGTPVTTRRVKGKVVRSGGPKWRKVNIGKHAKGFSLKVDTHSYSFFAVRVRCKQKTTTESKGSGYGKVVVTHARTWSAWNEKRLKLKIGQVPSLRSELVDGADNAAKFIYSYSQLNDTNKPFRSIQYQSATTTDGLEPTNWGDIASSAKVSDGITYTESTASLAAGSLTRWFRVRSQTARGFSAWRVSKRTYARPKSAVNLEAAYTGGNLSASWDVTSSKQFPVDSMDLAICAAVPDANGNPPSSASWATIGSYRYSSDNKKSSMVYQVKDSEKPGEDEVLFVRITVIHGHDSTEGATVIARGQYVAKAPTITSASVDATKTPPTATVAFTGNTALTISRTRISYRGGGAENWVTGSEMEAATSKGSVSFAIPGYDANKPVQFSAVNFCNPADGVAMQSAIAYSGDAGLPVVPSTFAVTPSGTNGTAEATWEWPTIQAGTGSPRVSADGIEVSWADHADAWESTDAPSTHDVASTRRGLLHITGLDSGRKWWFRARTFTKSEDGTSYSDYTATVTVDLSEAPTTPSLAITPDVITDGKTAEATWAYASGDGTAQAYAEVCECTIGATGITYGVPFAHTESAQHITLDAKALEWQAGTSHLLAVRVLSASGRFSDGWSTPAAVKVADPLTCVVSTASLTDKTVPINEADPNSGNYNYKALFALPITATVTGGDAVTLSIVRKGAYHVARPDGRYLDGYDGEAVVVMSALSGQQITIGNDQLIGRLDDGASYEIVASCTDSYGQTASAEVIPFVVEWSHQPVIPTAAIEIQRSGVALIDVPKPDGAAESDVFNVYRLSADLPQLIIQGGAYGTKYVDPYPASGNDAGYRVVSFSEYGDYITADDETAWADVEVLTGNKAVIIDWEGGSVQLPYDLKLDSSWAKRFERTVMLGGSVVGDWAPGVERDSSAASVVMHELQPEAVKSLRRLAEYDGICHVRTPEGSCYTADVQVSETEDTDDTASFTLDIKRVDGERLDGMTVAEWTAAGGEVD